MGPLLLIVSICSTFGAVGATGTTPVPQTVNVSAQSIRLGSKPAESDLVRRNPQRELRPRLCPS